MNFHFRDLFNNNTIVINPYGLISPKIHDEIVIAHVSDLHEKQFGINNEHLFESVQSLEPDIIAITGDLVAHENQPSADIQYTESIGRGLSEIAPTFFVTGNHERMFKDAICDALTGAGVKVLDGNIESLDIRGSRINISGMHDPSVTRSSMVQSMEVFESIEGYNIFLVHRPELFEALSSKNIDLILSGHTHAGQIRLPQISSLYMMGQGFFPKYMEGEFESGGTTMIISRGLGSSGYPTIRINNPPDLVAVAVMSPDKAKEKMPN